MTLNLKEKHFLEKQVCSENTDDAYLLFDRTSSRKYFKSPKHNGRSFNKLLLIFK